MKLYYFNPNDYGQEWFVMAQSKQDAIFYLLKYLTQKSLDDGETEDDDFYNEYLNAFKSALNTGDLPYKYTIEECEEGKVIQSEIS